MQDQHLPYDTNEVGFFNENLEELFGRKLLEEPSRESTNFYQGKKILITGAAGSIGTALCHRIVQSEAHQLILFDQNESGLHDLYYDLSFANPDIELQLIVGNVAQAAQVKKVFEKFRPEIVFHAAAYKHVPLMELQPAVAFHSNMLGTKVMADMAAKSHVEQFVFISSDKAIAPAGVLGATKRFGELYMQYISSKSHSNCSFITCRFGNVLNSNGSVLPLLRKQLKRNIPLTISHPDATRYFMTLEEASTFLYESVYLGGDSDVLFFDMGKQVRVLDLAEWLISKYKIENPSRSVEIKFTGLRPGEKLTEEKLELNEQTQQTRNSQIFKLKNADLNGTLTSEKVSELMTLVGKFDDNEVVNFIRSVVPLNFGNQKPSELIEYI